MTFYVKDAKDYQIADGVELECSELQPHLEIGAIKLVYDKDHAVFGSVDKVGYLMDGTGRKLHDYVADITVGSERFGMRRFAMGQLGPRWIVVGAPYDEPLATKP